MLGVMNDLASIGQLMMAAPRHLYEELFERRRYERSAIQGVSICGRKLITWSKKIDRELLKRACVRHKNATETEVCFAAVSSAVQSLLERYGDIGVPERCAVAARYVRPEYLLGKKQYDQGSHHGQ